MKLNESKLIAEIKRLAEAITNANDMSQVKSHADGIISICNILDTDLEPQPLVQPFLGSGYPHHYSDNVPIPREMFNNAKIEQQGE